MKTLAEIALQASVGPGGAKVRLWVNRGNPRAEIRDGKTEGGLGKISSADVPQSDAFGQVPYGVIAGDDRAALDDFTLRTNETRLPE